MNPFHSRLQSANETLKENIQQFTALVMHITGEDSTSVTCQIIIVLFIRHLFNKEIRKQVAKAKNMQTLRHAMILVKEAEINSKIQGSK